MSNLRDGASKHVPRLITSKFASAAIGHRRDLYRVARWRPMFRILDAAVAPCRTLTSLHCNRDEPVRRKGQVAAGAPSRPKRTRVLRSARDRCDMFNVTKDADLGYRLARDGYGLGVIGPPTI